MIVKICGITTEEDALLAAEAGASAIGFNFYHASPRYVTAETARRLGERLPSSVMKVGIFVNEPAAAIDAVAAEAGLDVVQLYGSSQAKGWRSWRSCHAGEALEDPEAEAFLIDTPPSDGLLGGTGRTFDWSTVRGLKQRVILAGGLDASNVRAAIEMARPWGVDACSRLESAPGRKDPRKVREFVRAALNEL